LDVKGEGWVENADGGEWCSCTDQSTGDYPCKMERRRQSRISASLDTEHLAMRAEERRVVRDDW
jgi:hypothetical protein